MMTTTMPLPIDIRPLNQTLAPAHPDDVFDELPDETVLKTGWLTKKGRRGNWKKRWFVLRSDRLAYYKDEKEYKTLRIIPALDINTVTFIKSKKPHTFAIFTSSRDFTLAAPSDQIAQEWIESLLHSSQLSAHRCEEELQELDQQHPAAPATAATSLSPVTRVAPSLAPLDTSSPLNAALHATTVASPQSLRGPSTEAPRLNSFESSGGYFSGTELSPSPLEASVVPPTAAAAAVGTTSAAAEEERQSFETDELEGLAEDRVVCQGYLLCLKNVSGVRQWKRRWVVLRGRSLTLYKNFEEYKPLRIMPLHSILAAVDTDPLSRSKRHCFQIVTKEKVLRFCADSEAEVDKWLGGLVSLIEAGKASGGHGLGGSKPA